MRIFTLLVGGLFGAGLTMLMTPRTGKETREVLRTRVNDRYGDVIEQGRIRATELIKTGRETLDGTITQGQDFVNTAIERARTTIDEVVEDQMKQRQTEPEKTETEEAAPATQQPH